MATVKRKKGDSFTPDAAAHPPVTFPSILLPSGHLSSFHLLRNVLSYCDGPSGTSFLLCQRSTLPALAPYVPRPGSVSLTAVGGRGVRYNYQATPRAMGWFHVVTDPTTHLQRAEAISARRRLLGAKATSVPRFSPWRRSGSAAGGVSLLASYPRSGNTLLRKILEGLTGTITGSDTRPDRTLSRALVRKGLVGEGLVGSCPIGLVEDWRMECLGRRRKAAGGGRTAEEIWDDAPSAPYPMATPVVKTHYPERRGHLPYWADRVILLVRNPYDAIESYFNMCLTNTHNLKLHESVRILEEHRALFEGMAAHESAIWALFISYWRKACRESGVPLLTIRYEDILRHPEETVRRVVGFAMAGRPLQNEEERLSEEWEERYENFWKIQTILERPRVGDEYRGPAFAAVSIGKSLSDGRYPVELIERMIGPYEGEVHRHLNEFGYNVFRQNFPRNMAETTTGGGRKKRDNDGGRMPKREQSLENMDGTGRVRVNVGRELRAPDDPYGRAMTDWRKARTDGDVMPFLTGTRPCDRGSRG